MDSITLTSLAIIHYTTFFKFFQYRELQADKTALKHSNQLEKEEAPKIFYRSKKSYFGIT